MILRLLDAPQNITILIVETAEMENLYAVVSIETMLLDSQTMGHIRKKRAVKLKTAVVMQRRAMLTCTGRQQLRELIPSGTKYSY